jgi:drug/metabolite transporter (DMT)-like permease
MTGSEAALAPPASARIGFAIALMLAAMLLFSMNDALGKWLVGTYSPAQLLLIRSLAALAILGAMLGKAGLAASVRVERPGLHVIRTLFSTADVTFFYIAVIYLPLADVMAFYMAAPIFVAALSPLVLGERIGWRRWTAIIVGFIGVLIALAPSAASFALPALLAVAGSVCFALFVLTTRALGAAPGGVLVLWQTVGALLVGLVVSPFAWRPPSAVDWLLLALLGIVSMGAHLCVTRSLSLAPAATVLPYQYTLLVWAVLFGYAVFGDVPTAEMLVGGGLIVAAGLFIFAREQTIARERSRT